MTGVTNLERLRDIEALRGMGLGRRRAVAAVRVANFQVRDFEFLG
jgi:hypothetical protein